MHMMNSHERASEFLLIPIRTQLIDFSGDVYRRDLFLMPTYLPHRRVHANEMVKRRYVYSSTEPRKSPPTLRGQQAPGTNYIKLIYAENTFEIDIIQWMRNLFFSRR